MSAHHRSSLFTAHRPPGALHDSDPRRRLVSSIVAALAALALVMSMLPPHTPGLAGQTQRVGDGLVGLYDFAEGAGDRVHDASARRGLPDLEIADEGAVTWVEDGLRIDGSTVLASTNRASTLRSAIGDSNAVTMEAWVSAAAPQGGPARILSLSSRHGESLMVGQGNHTGGQTGIETRIDTHRGRYMTRLQSGSGAVDDLEPTHVVASVDDDGAMRLYIDGELVGSDDTSHRVEQLGPHAALAMGNVLSGDRPWLGTLHLVAIYDRALVEDEVGANFAAGPRPGASSPADPDPEDEHDEDSSSDEDQGEEDDPTDGEEGTGSEEGHEDDDTESPDDGSGSDEDTDTEGPGDGSDSDDDTDTESPDDGSGTDEDADDGGEDAERNPELLDGIVALYDFTGGEGDTLAPVSGSPEDTELKITDTSATEWGDDGLALRDSTLLQSSEATSVLIDEVGASNQLSVEAWVTPDNLEQGGPARIVGLASPSQDERVLVGQGNHTGSTEHIEARVDSAAGYMTRLQSPGVLTTTLTHVVATYDADGAVRLYLDGELQAEGSTGHRVDDWHEDVHLLIGNRADGERPWLGTVHEVGLYDTALDATRVADHYLAGPSGGAQVPTDDEDGDGDDAPREEDDGSDHDGGTEPDAGTEPDDGSEQDDGYEEDDGSVGDDDGEGSDEDEQPTDGDAPGDEDDEVTPGEPLGATDSITRHGITWTFAAEHPYGTYANGDYWVEGPVEIVDIHPRTRESDGWNGSMVNPPAQGPLGYGGYMGFNYDPALNVGLATHDEPHLVAPESSLVSTVGREAGTSGSQVETAAVLTVVEGAPAKDSFRPPYTGDDKVHRHTADDLDFGRLRRLPLVDGAPDPETYASQFERVWLDHVGDWIGNRLHPHQAMPNYGRDLANELNRASLTLMLDYEDHQKHQLLVNFLQIGIDFHGIVEAGGTDHWHANGGHASGRKWPILFAGYMLDDADMRGIGQRDDVSFGEDQQTFFVEMLDGQPNGGHGGYTEEHLGMPEWRFGSTIDSANVEWDLAYRHCCTTVAWSGAVLSARLLGLTDAWNHPALFEYQDRYIAKEHRFWDDFSRQMWEAYRH